MGTGSGILALFAAKAGAKKVYAVEATNMAKNARLLVEHNKVRVRGWEWMNHVQKGGMEGVMGRGRGRSGRGGVFRNPERGSSVLTRPVWHGGGGLPSQGAPCIHAPCRARPDHLPSRFPPSSSPPPPLR